MALIRRAVEQGWYANPDPRASQIVAAEVLVTLQKTTSLRTKLTAARTHATLMRLNLQTLETLARIDAIAAANESPPADVIRLPAGGPWGSLPLMRPPAPTPDAADPPADEDPVDGPEDRSI